MTQHNGVDDGQCVDNWERRPDPEPPPPRQPGLPHTMTTLENDSTKTADDERGQVVTTRQTEKAGHDGTEEAYCVHNVIMDNVVRQDAPPGLYSREPMADTENPIFGDDDKVEDDDDDTTSGDAMATRDLDLEVAKQIVCPQVVLVNRTEGVRL